jgi:NAD-dependent oxidoreductase involved in siderophore biosynthesis
MHRLTGSSIRGMGCRCHGDGKAAATAMVWHHLESAVDGHPDALANSRHGMPLPRRWKSYCRSDGKATATAMVWRHLDSAVDGHPDALANSRHGMPLPRRWKSYCRSDGKATAAAMEKPLPGGFS